LFLSLVSGFDFLRTHRFFIHRIGAALALWAVSMGAPATELNNTLQKIKNTGVIYLGQPERALQFPFVYLDEEKRPIGFSSDIAQKIVEALQLRLGMPRLEVKMVLMTSQNRFTLINSGAIDLICTSTTNTVERQKQFAFSNSFFVSTTKLLTRLDSGIRKFSDLAGKRVVVNALTTSEDLLRKFDADNKMGIQIMAVTDLSTSPMTLLETGQADAYMADDALLYGRIAHAWRPQDWLITGAPLSREAYGCLMRKGDTAFKAVVDDTIASMMKSGKIRALYRRWFESPVPPAGVNLKFPMSKDMEMLIRNPNDQAL
jgi:glutamate/aspartate transport system substrate-binding protein